MSSQRVLVCLCGLVTLILPVLATFRGIEGNYCLQRGRGDECCRGRIDECSVPILGTMCYCDVFCNRTNSDDCCPDYWEVCLGLEPIRPTRPPEDLKSCYHNGKYYSFGETAMINCNKCKCSLSSNYPAQTEFLCETNRCIIEDDLINAVNAAQLGWSASNYSKFYGKTLNDGLLYKTGTLEPEVSVKRMFPIQKNYDPSSIPRSFDSRTKWPGKIQAVMDQGWCGSSWAFSTVSLASDRLAIQSEGNEILHLSPQNLLSCNNRGQRGCEGGYLDRAWNHFRKYGVVEERCYPYLSGYTGTIESCQIPHRANTFQLECDGQRIQMNKKDDIHYAQPAYRISENANDIMHEIMTSGPVQATVRVHHDLFLYKNGIYHPSNMSPTDRTSYHSVRIIGWGEEYINDYPEKYWLIANSWGEDWGENGFFRVRRGTGVIDVEKFVIAVWMESLQSKRQ